MTRPELEAAPVRTNHITEAELFLGYSDLADHPRYRSRRYRAPIETVRRAVAAAYGPLAADGVSSREDGSAPEDAPAEAAR